MSNPNNAVGTNAAYSGRTSVNAFNDGLAAYGRGILSGWVASPSTGLKVQLGGAATVRDVAVAVDNAGNHTTINNISGAPIEMTITAAPSTNSRIDAIVAYVDNPAEGVSTVADNPAACGMIVVKGTAAASPSEPNESTIRAAITADGASGVTAYYAVLATVTIASGTTDLTSSNIEAGPSATFADYSLTEIKTSTKWVDGSVIYKKTVNIGALPNNTIKSVPHGITNLNKIIKIEGTAYHPVNNVTKPLPFTSLSGSSSIQLSIIGANIEITTGTDRSGFTYSYTTLYYTKTS